MESSKYIQLVSKSLTSATPSSCRNALTFSKFTRHLPKWSSIDLSNVRSWFPAITTLCLCGSWSESIKIDRLTDDWSLLNVRSLIRPHLHHNMDGIIGVRVMVHFFLYLTPLSTIFQLHVYCGGKFYQKPEYPEKNDRPVASHWQTSSQNVVSSTPRHEQDLNSQLKWW